MAQFETSSRTGNSRNKKRRMHKPIFVDLTPMVDLAFLLITFFMLTTAMTKPKAMELLMPETEGPDMKIIPACMLTIIADKENTVWYYVGDAMSELHQTGYSDTGLRQLLYEHIRRVNSSYKKDGLVCIIKLTQDANYQNIVSILDEMIITDVKSYAVQDLTGKEQEELKKQTEKK